MIAEDLPPVVLVGGIGLPWLRDLDFGTQFVRRVEAEEWPDGVVVDDLSYAAHRVLHRLQDLEPARVILVGAMPRDVDPPGTVRRYLLDLTPPPAEEVHERLTEAVGGIIDLDHTLAVVRHWKGFPTDTVVIEVEPADKSFGLGFSDEVEAVVESVLAMVREEVVRPFSEPAVDPVAVAAPVGVVAPAVSEGSP
ncbi:MAG: hydrogenase maturation protease [Acidimicrobiales bacterium]